MPDPTFQSPDANPASTLHVFQTLDVIYESPLEPQGVLVHLTAPEWDRYQNSLDQRCEVTYTLMDCTSHQAVFDQADHVHLLQQEGFPDRYRLTFWMSAP